MANPILSFRAPPQIKSAVDAIVEQEGTSYATVLTELIEEALKARSGKPERDEAGSLVKILEAVEELRERGDRKRLDEHDRNDALVGAVEALERLPAALGEELGLLHSKTVEALAARIERLEQAMRRGVAYFMILGHPQADKNAIREQVNTAFDS